MTQLRPPQELESPIPENERLTSPMQSDGVDQELSQFLLSLPRAPRGWGANQSLQRTRPSRHCCNRTPSWAGSLSLGR